MIGWLLLASLGATAVWLSHAMAPSRGAGFTDDPGGISDALAATSQDIVSDVVGLVGFLVVGVAVVGLLASRLGRHPEAEDIDKEAWAGRVEPLKEAGSLGSSASAQLDPTLWSHSDGIYFFFESGDPRGHFDLLVRCAAGLPSDCSSLVVLLRPFVGPKQAVVAALGDRASVEAVEALLLASQQAGGQVADPPDLRLPAQSYGPDCRPREDSAWLELRHAIRMASYRVEDAWASPSHGRKP